MNAEPKPPVSHLVSLARARPPHSHNARVSHSRKVDYGTENLTEEVCLKWCLVSGVGAVWRARTAIGAGSGREPGRWCCSKIITNAILLRNRG
jgi:hypothetical protein